MTARFTHGAAHLESGHRLKRKTAIDFLCLLLVLGSARFAAGAEPGAPIRDFAVRTWDRTKGLPDDSVTAILQTRDGFLWVGTSTKLVRFDGVQFLEFPLPLADASGPARVTALCEDSTGKLWVGTQQDGLICLDRTVVKSYRKKSGLLDDSVTSLSADAEGRVWIGTRAGLNRWDGKGFSGFTAKDGLTDVSVSGVHVARSGVVWITTRSGMYQFKDNRIMPYEFETDSQGRRPEFLGAYEDRRTNLWAYGDTYLINLSVEKRLNHFRGVDATRIWSLCEGRDGRLWIGTSGRGLVCFGDNSFQPVTINELHWPNDVRAICEDREGNLWLGTSGGGLMELLPQPVEVLRADQGLPPGAATCLTTDASGRIFAGFEVGGLFAGDAWRFERFPGNGGLEGPNLVSSLCVASDETLWIATLGNGLYGVRGGRKVHLTTINGLADNSIPAICATADGALWVGTQAGALQRVKQMQITTYGKNAGLPGTPITALLPARDGGLWLGTEDGQVLRRAASGAPGFVLVYQSPAVSGQAILALHEDLRGRLWMGTAGAGLRCWTGQRCASWTTLNGLPDDGVYGVLEDAGSDLWLATGRGIYRVSRETVQEALLKGDALRGKLMFAAKRTADQILSFGWPRALPASDGRLWFATAEGLIAVDRSGPDLSRVSAPPVYLANIVVNGKPIRAGAPEIVPPLTSGAAKMVRMPADLESLEIQFTAPSFVAPEKLNFRYKLEGQDRDWVAAGSDRRARYGRLSYGDYRFRVQASQVDGVWNEAAERFAFTVPTPLWRTSAALAFYILAAVGLVTGVVRVVSTRRLRLHLAQLEQQRVVERERMRIAQDMHDDIGSKLTKISFLSERAKMELGAGSEKLESSSSKLSASSSTSTNSEILTSNSGLLASDSPLAGQIESIATTSRELLQTLDEIVWAVNPRNDSLEHLAAYLSHYAAEYFQNTEVQCEMRLPRDLPHHPLSAELRHNLFLAFEEVLNNALKHSGASSVGIEMLASPRGFQINVTDNGQGFDAAAAQVERPASVGRRGGNGLVNMRQRLSVVGGECVVRSQPGKGTTVSLRIPLGNPAKIKL